MVVIVLDFQVIVRTDCVQDDYVTKFKGGFHSYYTLFSSRVTYSQVKSCRVIVFFFLQVCCCGCAEKRITMLCTSAVPFDLLR